jgi:hypothetical protein
MHRDDMVDVEVDQSFDSLPDIVLVMRRQVETSEDRVNLFIRVGDSTRSNVARGM